MIKGDSGGNFTLMAREGAPLAGAPAGWLADFLDGVAISNVGVGYEVASVDGGEQPGVGSEISGRRFAHVIRPSS